MMLCIITFILQVVEHWLEREIAHGLCLNPVTSVSRSLGVFSFYSMFLALMSFLFVSVVLICLVLYLKKIILSKICLLSCIK